MSNNLEEIIDVLWLVTNELFKTKSNSNLLNWINSFSFSKGIDPVLVIKELDKDSPNIMSNFYNFSLDESFNKIQDTMLRICDELDWDMMVGDPEDNGDIGLFFIPREALRAMDEEQEIVEAKYKAALEEDRHNWIYHRED